jgi:uncharacterized surface protein with fasciclin (FAS1) repeats
MKPSSYFRLFFLSCLAVVLFSACKKNQELATTSRPTILQYISKDPQLSLLQTAITRSHLDTVFSSGGPYTFFCPVDSAFTAAGLTADSIAHYDPDSLSSLLKYHILSGKFSSQDVVGFLTESVTCLDSAWKPYISKNYFGIFLNGIGVTQGDLEMGDGVIQKIRRVAFPPKRTVLQCIDSLPELSYFDAVVNKVPQFRNILSQLNTIPFYLVGQTRNGASTSPGGTVFAPVNTAFQNSLYPSIDAINQADPLVLESVFGGYILNGFIFTSDFLGGYLPVFTELPAIGATYKVDKDGITLIPNYPVGVPPRIIHPDVLCTDGVLQEISEVFIAD